ncbi:MAG: DUF2630 family protein [Actinomycetota bacterium]
MLEEYLDQCWDLLRQRRDDFTRKGARLAPDPPESLRLPS